MKRINISWKLLIYDALILAAVDFLLLGLYRGIENLPLVAIAIHYVVSLICVLSARLIGRIYQQVWRYGGIQCYIRLLTADFAAFCLNLVLKYALPVFIPAMRYVTFARLLSIACTNLLLALTIRMVYRYAYKCGHNRTPFGRFLLFLLR